MKKILLIAVFILPAAFMVFGQIVSSTTTDFDIINASVYVDHNDYTVIKKSAELLQQDIQQVTGKEIPLIHSAAQITGNTIIIGSPEKSALIKQLVKQKQINTAAITGKWEAYTIQTIRPHATSPLKAANGIVITGNNRRGVAFGVFELSKQIGVSPWYWWADVPVKQSASIYINNQVFINDAPKVKYRGIFINDEAPALSSWSKEKFGGFNHLFYAKVFELMLRLKSNYIWPAMWGNAFYDDDAQNIQIADDYAIVIGTSHHEPLMRAHAEWKKYGSGEWNYDHNETRLKDFWKGGMQRGWNEKIVTVGMRGDGDEPMSRETATALLERIVTDQRKIIKDVTKKPAEQTPQLWALYKEVQDYYDKGLRVPDDITLLICDDNWGNIRRVPAITEPKRKGGYGMYYHFDYVGGPRSYKWINTNPVTRVWEQMNLAWQHGIDKIWIVNVGDIKPMEFPISFWCDYAWNPDAIGADDLQAYTEQWAAAQFGTQYAKEIAAIISTYTKYNGRRKPELVDARTFSLETGEWLRVYNEYQDLYNRAETITKSLPAACYDAYFQLVLHPVKAMANLYALYYNVALNRAAFTNNSFTANQFADEAKLSFIKDSLITLEYHRLNDGKWNHLMNQTHIGYRGWQDPRYNIMPEVKYMTAVPANKNNSAIRTASTGKTATALPGTFYEKDKIVSIEAAHYTNAVNANGINWKILPDHGRTGDAVTTLPVTQKSTTVQARLEYEFYSYSTDSLTLLCYFSPTYNLHNQPEGLQFAVSIDDEVPQIISLNANAHATEGGIMYDWVANNIIIKKTKHTLKNAGKHTLKYWMINSGVVLQKLVLDFGGLQPSYLGPEETLYKN